MTWTDLVAVVSSWQSAPGVGLIVQYCRPFNYCVDEHARKSSFVWNAPGIATSIQKCVCVSFQAKRLICHAGRRRIFPRRPCFFVDSVSFLDLGGQDTFLRPHARVPVPHHFQGGNRKTCERYALSPLFIAACTASTTHQSQVLTARVG